MTRQAYRHHLHSPRPWQVSALLLLLHRRDARPLLSGGSDLVPVSRSVLPEWPQLACFEAPQRQHLVRPTGQCLRRDRRLGHGPDRYRGFNLFDDDDQALFEVLCRGEFLIPGFRNGSLRQHLKHFRPSQVSRLLKRLRLHVILSPRARAAQAVIAHVESSERRSLNACGSVPGSSLVQIDRPLAPNGFRFQHGAGVPRPYNSLPLSHFRQPGRT